jgi:hypothetical protein
MHSTRHQNGIGGAPCLHARRNVGRIAENLDFVAAHLIDHHPSTVNTDANLRARDPVYLKTACL